MSSEAAAYQAAQQRHHQNMTFGKKQRYIEVFQCSGEDMNHVLTPSLSSANSVSIASPVKTTAATSTPATPAGQTPGVAAVNGLLPPGMFNTVPPASSQNTFGPGLDPNSILAAAQMQSPLLYLPAQRPPTADVMGLFYPGGAPQITPAPIRQPLMTAPQTYNPLAMVQVQQQQLLQQQLLQSQLAAQRFLLSNATSASSATAQPGLIGPRPNTKRSFDQAFSDSQNAASEAAKRSIYGNPTISAAPTTYHSR